MKHKRTDLAEQLRRAWRESGLSRYMLAKRSGVGYSIIHRFAAGERDLKLQTASKLCDVLGLELRPAGPVSRRTKSAKRKG